MRPIVVILAALLSPASALACGMYIPPSQDRAVLADVLDAIDGAAAVATGKKEVRKPEVKVEVRRDAADAAEANRAASAPTPEPEA